MKRILITGKDSYIGKEFEAWLRRAEYKGMYQADTVDMRDGLWRDKDFSCFDVVLHVAGIAHRRETKANRSLYYEVNRDLAIETAKKAKEEGVRHFILLSTMNVYGKIEGIITGQTPPSPVTHYGKSKLEADIGIQKMESNDFKVAIVRPPMVYGNGCKGNFPKLAGLAGKTRFFPAADNRRSMIYIENLCDCIELIIRLEKRGVFHPQNGEYVSTEALVRKIAECHGHRVIFIPFLAKILRRIGGAGGKKVFGTLIYDMDKERYGKISFDTSIEKTESLKIKTSGNNNG